MANPAQNGPTELVHPQVRRLNRSNVLESQQDDDRLAPKPPRPRLEPIPARFVFPLSQHEQLP